MRGADKSENAAESEAALRNAVSWKDREPSDIRLR